MRYPSRLTSKSQPEFLRQRIHASERDIQKACIDWLNTVPGIAVWRRNVGAQTLQHNGKRRFVRFGVLGEGDIDGIGPFGVRISIECKAYPNKPTDNQWAWMDMIERHGGIAFWVWSRDGCENQLKAEFEKRGWPWRKEWEC